MSSLQRLGSKLRAASPDNEEDSEEEFSRRSSSAPNWGPRSEVLARGNGGADSGRKWQGERVYKERVLVRVYDLGQTFVTRWHNKVSKSYGAFHSGVEVYGQEWSFGMTADDVSSGVTWNRPGENQDHSFRETLSMGYTTLSPREVGKIIAELKREWMGCTYNVLMRNCHNFSDCLCGRLGVARLPAWVNDLAQTGARSVEYLDTSDSGYDGGKALVDFWGSMKSKMYTAFAGEPPAPWPPVSEEVSAEERQRQQENPARQHNPFSVLRRR